MPAPGSSSVDGRLAVVLTAVAVLVLLAALAWLLGPDRRGVPCVDHVPAAAECALVPAPS